MKKNKLQDAFLAELIKVPIVQVAAEKTSISRNSIYRWRKDDKEFSKKMDEAIRDGVALVNDMSESQLLTLIKEKNYSAISFWLRHRNDNYKDKVHITAEIEQEIVLSPEQEALVRRGLELVTLSGLTNNNHGL